MTEIRLSVIAKCLGASLLAAALTACSNDGKVVSTPTGVAALSGSFVFTVTGTDPSDGDYAVAGSFVADGMGNITSAVADYNLGSGIDANVPLTGTYTVAGSTVNVTLSNAGKQFTDTFTSSLVTSGSAAVANFDGTGSGTLYPQVNSNFNPVGTYTFSVKGEGQGTVTGSGSMVAGAGGTLTSGSLTYTDAATTATYTSVTGFINAPESGGRGQASLQGNNLAYYVVNASQVLMIGLDHRALLLIPAQKS